MLIDLMTGEPIEKVPYPDAFALIESRLHAEEMLAIKSALNEMIDGSRIQTAGWMPGSDWEGTVFEPLYTKAAQRNHELSGKLFGLVVWLVFQERPEKWSSGRFEKNGEPIGSRTYFRFD